MSSAIMAPALDRVQTYIMDRDIEERGGRIPGEAGGTLRSLNCPCDNAITLTNAPPKGGRENCKSPASPYRLMHHIRLQRRYTTVPAVCLSDLLIAQEQCARTIYFFFFGGTTSTLQGA